MIDFAWAWALLLLPAPLLVLKFGSPLKTQQAALWVPNVQTFASPVDEQSEMRIHNPIRLMLLSLAWIMLVVAIARPHWSGEPTNLPTSGRDLLLAVDISGSMRTDDMELAGMRVQRLDVVKSVVNDFIDKREGDRVGLILFGTQAYLQSPLTFDHKSVKQLLSEAPVGIAGGKTAIGDAIGLAVKRLRKRPADEKVLILLTDGANNMGALAPVKAAQLANRDNIRVHTVGVGSDHQRRPGILGSFSSIVNPSADLDEPTLKEIAATTGGEYYRARETDELFKIYDLINQLEPVEQEAETFRPITSLFHWPLTAALICFLLLILPKEFHVGAR